MTCASYSAITFSALLHLFFTLNSADFMTGGGGRKNISCPRAQGTLALKKFWPRIVGSVVIQLNAGECMPSVDRT